MLFVIIAAVITCVTSQPTSSDVCANDDDNTRCLIQSMQNIIDRQAAINRDQEERIRLIEQSVTLLFDCENVLQNGFTSSGIYEIHAGRSNRLMRKSVYCDMQTDGGGWTVFQRRMDGSEDFRRSWNEFKEGFGNATGEHWLGNEYVHHLTSNRDYMVRIDLEDWEGESRYAVYSLFRVHSEHDKYRLELGAYSGTAGDGGQGLSYHNGAKFSTWDETNDNRQGTSCIDHNGYGGFWLDECMRVGVNNFYSHSSTGYGRNNFDKIRWDAWRGSGYSLKSTKMMIRAIND